LINNYSETCKTFDADINFAYDSNGFIIGFDIGEIEAKTSTGQEFNS